MKQKLLYLLFFASLSSYAQYTAIPDVNFEVELIRQGIDSGIPDGKVLTSKINTLTSLNVRSTFITDLTGIQDFTALTSLYCDSNQLTALDVSKNTALTYLSFGDNYLTAIDVSNNTALIELRCYHNQLTTLDVSNNTALTTLHCYDNQLKALDFSKNTALTYLDCSSNQLTGLNLKNGNNSNLSTNSAFNGNTNLSCIQVDNVAYANANWVYAKDAAASYSLDCSAFVQYTLIPDVNFENMLILLGYDSGAPDGKVPTSKVSGVTSLDISGRSITNLTGIQDFVALQSLNCSGNQLTALDVSKNIALKYLVCYSNQLTVLDVSKSTALEQLTCYSNKLTTLDVSNNGALTYLYCYENQLTALDVSKNIALTNLLCYSNQLTSLNVSQNVSLTELKCYSNQLTSFDVSKSIVLTKLYCYSNQLTALDVSKNIALIELYCYSNQLTALDVSKNTVLKYIDCNSNQLTSLNLKNGNNEYFNTYKFTNNPNLSCIQVDNDYYSNSSWNSYKDATASYNKDCLSSTLIPDVNFEKKLISLGIDSGTANGQVPTYKINTLNYLDVSNSSIADLTGIQDFVGLYTLNCSGNQVTALDVSKNSSIYSLNCSSNELTSLNLKTGTNTYLSTRNFTNNPNLSCIQVDNASYSAANWATAKDATTGYSTDCAVAVQYTLIPDINFEKELITQGIDYGTADGKVLTASISSLIFLDVAGGDITDLTGIQDFVALHTFYCNGNQLTTLDFSKNTALQSLMCEFNKLTSLDVSKNTALRFLSCTDNQLTILDVSKNTALEQLVCYSNQLTALDVSKNTALTNLLCYDNQLTSLNLKNGKNVKLSNRDFTNNPNLSCIQVDDVAYSNTNWASKKDATANYSTDCTPYTLIPDVNFENKLISLGIDSGVADGKVLTANVALVTSLNVASSNIADLTGIEDFTALTELICRSNNLTTLDLSKNKQLTDLNCPYNKLTSLDVSQNVNLIYLDCSTNQITSLDVTKNVDLYYLYFNYNKLTTIDVSKNVGLTRLVCISNQLTSLDVSKNVNLGFLVCENNSLTNLNLKNGTNTLLTNSNLNLIGNPNLTCIQVDDVTYSNANWAAFKDATASYSSDCGPYTLIPDVNFENKLISLGIDSGVADGKVPTANVDKLTSLDVSLSSISDLTGIQDFTSLKELICTANYLTTLDISKNSALLSLQCNVNNLSVLDVSKNLSLESLKCSHNHVTSLDVSNNLSLTTLMCDTNQLSDLDVSKNLELSVLLFDYNQLTAIDVSKNTLLNTLGFSFNNLTGIDVSNNTNLGFLNCPSNQITDLDVSHNLQLSTLYCNDNKIISLDVSKNSSLSYLFCQNNKLLDLNLKNGNQTHFANNYLDFTGNTNLTCIQVDDAIYSNANWSSIKDATANFNTDCSTSNLYTYIPDVNFENKLISLGIESGATDGKVLTSKISSITSLDVTSSLISDLTGIQGFSSLKELICNANNLTTLDVSKNLVLTRLECSNNKLDVLDVSKNLSLESLRCEVNYITSLDVSNNLSLGALFCYTNLLSDLDVSKNLLLTTLYFDNNKISTIDVSKNTILGALSYSGNNVTTIDVSKNSSLGFLNCQSNQVTNLDISHNLILNSLFCNDNQITSLDISKNNSVVFLLCQNNKLLDLNLKNGSNAHYDTRFLNFTGNPSLTCIQVDDVAYSNANWANLKDITANYSTDCNLVYTLIPNSSFEQKLIDLGIDTDGLNGKISTTSIESITSLDLSNTNITDLTGIENFTALKYFTANGNNLTSVDFSKNLMLQYISISGNNLTSLDVSKNTNLSELDFSNNKITQIDLSQNKELTVLNALGNQLTTLDISQNPKIKSLNVEFNQLTSLNLQNGNNANFVLAQPTSKKSQTVFYTSFLNNPNLSCIKVDNVAYSNTNWANIKDVTASYSSTCSKLGIEDSVFDKVVISPNPTKDELHIDNIVLEKATVYDALGKLVKTTTFTSGANNNTIHLEGFPCGIYYIYLESEGANTAKKIIVE